MPLEVYVSKFAHMRFEAAVLTNDADIRTAKSIVVYIFRWMGKRFLSADFQEELGMMSPEVRAKLAEGYRGETLLAAAEAAPLKPPRQARRRCSTTGRTQSSARGAAPDGPDGLVLNVPRLRNEHRL